MDEVRLTDPGRRGGGTGTGSDGAELQILFFFVIST
jgi:hypothetical protein